MEGVAAACAGALLLTAVLVVLLFGSRQRTLSRRVGSFACAFREVDQAGSTAGIAQYATGRLVWWRTFSLAPRPSRTWSRTDLMIVERVRLPEADEHGRRLVHVRCAHREEVFELTMCEPAFAGLVSWLEAGPRPVGRVV